MDKSTRGGKRPGAGRKRIAVKKEIIFAYVLSTDIQAVGGKTQAKIIAEQAIMRRAKKCG